jgi:hypothetical protein
VALATLGKREREAGDRELSASERPVVRRQAFGVIARSVAIAVAVSVAAYLL